MRRRSAVRQNLRRGVPPSGWAVGTGGKASPQRTRSARSPGSGSRTSSSVPSVHSVVLSRRPSSAVGHPPSSIRHRPLLLRPDFVFRRERLVVFVDGCFWHGCPEHGTWPKQNADFWRNKIETNMRRDRDTNERLVSQGWEVIRVWEHEEPDHAARRIYQVLALTLRGGMTVCI